MWLSGMARLYGKSYPAMRKSPEDNTEVYKVLSLLELCGSYVFLLAVGIRTALQKAQLSTVRNIQRAFGRT